MNRDPQRFERVPYFENPAWFTKPVVDKNGKVLVPAKNFYYAHGSETTVIFEPTQTFCLLFDENPNNMFNRQYVETVDGKWYDITAGYKLIIGETFKSSKIQRTVDFNDFCTYLSTNKHNKVLKQLLTNI